jgi:hypothetical protein
MSTQISWQTIVRLSGKWVALLVLPIVANIFVWRVVVVPQQATLNDWRDTQAMIQLKPKLAALVSESGPLLKQWEQTGFEEGDSAAVMQTLQRLADRHRVQVKELTAQGRQKQAKAAPAAPSGTVPVSLQVSGRFSKLAHWISDVESTAGLQIDDWSMSPGQGKGEPHQMTVSITAFTRKSS